MKFSAIEELIDGTLQKKLENGMLCAMESVFYPTGYEGDTAQKDEPFYQDIDNETK